MKYGKDGNNNFMPPLGQDQNPHDEQLWKPRIVPKPFIGGQFGTESWGRILPPKVNTFLDTFVCVPPFNGPNVVSTIRVIQFNYTSLTTVSFSGWQNLQSEFVENSASKDGGFVYFVCVKWRVGTKATRYILVVPDAQYLQAFFPNGLVNTLHATMYNGQIIPKNFSIEIWTTSGCGDNYQLNLTINVLTSLKVLPQSINDSSPHALTNIASQISFNDAGGYVPFDVDRQITFNGARSIPFDARYSFLSN